MKKLLTKSILAVSLLGLVLSFNYSGDYAGIPSEHSPIKNTVKYELAGIPSEHSPIKLMGIPSEH